MTYAREENPSLWIKAQLAFLGAQNKTILDPDYDIDDGGLLGEKEALVALLPGKTELFDLAADPGETSNVADQHPEIVKDLEARLSAYAKEQKPSLWIKAQITFIGAQGKTILDPDYDIDDGGLPGEKEALPAK